MKHVEVFGRRKTLARKRAGLPESISIAILSTTRMSAWLLLVIVPAKYYQITRPATVYFVYPTRVTACLKSASLVPLLVKQDADTISKRKHLAATRLPFVSISDEITIYHLFEMTASFDLQHHCLQPCGRIDQHPALVRRAMPSSKRLECRQRTLNAAVVDAILKRIGPMRTREQEILRSIRRHDSG